ncbi:MAG: bifunctional oligoribonuclease/PAP phosphatase NrnA [Bacteroidales bacterium]|nr:bifunctional oligoribonuclease/PAP phosphatase NrnA [Bacteroidales bacterium]
MLKRNDKRIWQDTSTIFSLLRNGSRKITIITHLDPDGDAIGSSLGLLKVLQNMGHRCHVISPNEYADFLKWMPGNDAIRIFDKEPRKAVQLLNQAEIIVSVDFNTVRRIKQFTDIVTASGAYKLLIDHHPDPESFADCILSDTSASSTAEIVYEFLKLGGLDQFMDADSAACLFTGIMTDTGCFSYNSSKPGTYRAVAELLDYEFDKDRIYSMVYDDFTCKRMRLLGFCLNNKMEVLREYRTAYIWLTMKELQEYDFQVGDTEGFVNYPLSISGIRFSAFFIEKKDHIKASFRSKGGFPVNHFAEKYYNGGGHVNASGGESTDTMRETLERFKKLVILQKDHLSDGEIQ